MSSDDQIKKVSYHEEKITIPMISDLFRLVEELKQSTEARFDSMKEHIDGRFDAMQQHVDGRLDAMRQYVDGRFDALSDEMRNGFTKLVDMIDRDRLHAEADYHDLLKRIRHIESRAS
jgi:DNA anti-recombination protein RmuC